LLLETFQKFLDIRIIELVVTNTNSYAEYHYYRYDIDNTFLYAYPWKPTITGEVYRYIGV